MRNVFRNWSTRLPFDGQGLLPSSDPLCAQLRRWAATRFWQRAPLWSRPFLIALARLAWLPVTAVRVKRFSRKFNLSERAAWRLLGDCLSSGAQPVEALIWRRYIRPEPHPLPSRAASTLLRRLGSAAEHRLLSDKLIAGDKLKDAGVLTPPLLTVLPRGGQIDVSIYPWNTPGVLFIKPRFGWASRGAVAVDVVAPGQYRVGRGQTSPLDALEGSALADDELLVQSRLTAHSELADLAVAGAAPVLRLTTARRPGEAPFLHSALLSIDVPGERPQNFVRGQIRVPVDPVRGRMCSGVWFLRPDERFNHLPWNAAPLADRTLPMLGQAVSAALQAMAIVPGLPLVNWDIILSPEGPVVLEGNTAGNWILTNLAPAQGVPAAPLIPLLSLWANEIQSPARGLAKRETLQALHDSA